MESAEILSEKLNLQPIILKELSERNWGRWEGKSWEWIKQKLDKMDLDERYTFIPPGGEAWKQMEQRLIKALNKVTGGKGQSSEDSPLKTVNFKNGEAVIIEIDSGCRLVGDSGMTMKSCIF